MTATANASSKSGKPADWETAVNAVPSCCQIEEHLQCPGDPLQPGDWVHLIDIVAHPIQLTLIEDQDAYTRSEARECVQWLRKFAPKHEMAKL